MPDESATTLPTPEAVQDVLASEPEETQIFNTPEERVIASKIIPILSKKAYAQAEAMKGKELEREIDALRTSNKRAIDAEIEKFRAASAPPTSEELEKLLNQEYSEFSVKIQPKGPKGTETFTIRELPQAVELRFLKAIQTRLVPHLQKLASVEWTSGMSMVEKLQNVIDIVPEVFDVLAECCAIALDPFEEESIDGEWVRKHLSSFRIMSIIQAQMTAGRLRDFFSLAYRATKSQMTA